MPDSDRTVKIVTDSAADIPADLARELDITVIPLLVHMGGHTYRDGVDLTGEEFYRELASVGGVTTTSLPSLHSLEEAYRSLTRDGYEIVSVHLSSKLSGTFNAALMACTGDGVEAEAVSVVDSRTVSMAQGWIAIRCAEAARAGKSREEIEELAESLASRTYIFGMLDTLEYVVRSGRVGRIPGTIGNMLSIKPLITIRPNGEAIILERIRTEKRALERMLEMTAEKGELDAVAVMHGANEEGAAQLLQMLRQRLNLPEPVVMGHIGAVLGTHIGPGAVGVGFMTK
jgi:DegV family protein with EDD domain